MSNKHPLYLTCVEVAERLGLGKRRRRRRNASAPLSDEERHARPVRQLIQVGKLKGIKLDNGEWRIREDWLEQYEAALFLRAERERVARLEALCGHEEKSTSPSSAPSTRTRRENGKREK